MIIELTLILQIEIEIILHQTNEEVIDIFVIISSTYKYGMSIHRASLLRFCLTALGLFFRIQV